MTRLMSSCVIHLMGRMEKIMLKEGDHNHVTVLHWSCWTLHDSTHVELCYPLYGGYGLGCAKERRSHHVILPSVLDECCMTWFMSSRASYFIGVIDTISLKGDNLTLSPFQVFMVNVAWLDSCRAMLSILANDAFGGWALVFAVDFWI